MENNKENTTKEIKKETVNEGNIRFSIEFEKSIVEKLYWDGNNTGLLPDNKITGQFHRISDELVQEIGRILLHDMTHMHCEIKDTRSYKCPNGGGRHFVHFIGETGDNSQFPKSEVFIEHEKMKEEQERILWKQKQK